MVKAVILNDTRGDNHFGCFRVMRVIEENLARRGIEVIGRSLVRNNWQADAAFLASLAQADLIVINGEGTLHHGSRQGERLLAVVDHPARGQKPVALINTLYQDNPGSWSRYLEKIDLISTRDAWSAEAASNHAGRTVGHVPDLSLWEGAAESTSTARGDLVLIGDSVIRSVSERLITLADSRPDARFLPILTTIKPPKPHYRQPFRALRNAYIHTHALAFRLRHPHVWFNRDEAGFMHSLKKGALHATGRFHSICLCLVTGTPFIALESNSWKIRALLDEFDLGPDRLVDIDDLPARLSDPALRYFSMREQAAIAKRLSECVMQTQALFDRIAELAGGEPSSKQDQPAGL